MPPIVFNENKVVVSVVAPDDQVRRGEPSVIGNSPLGIGTPLFRQSHFEWQAPVAVIHGLTLPALAVQ